MPQRVDRGAWYIWWVYPVMTDIGSGHSLSGEMALAVVVRPFVCGGLSVYLGSVSLCFVSFCSGSPVEADMPTHRSLGWFFVQTFL